MTGKRKERVEVFTCRCPFCQRLMLYVPSRAETMHENPVCAVWLKYCKENGAETLGLVEVELHEPN